MKTRKKRDLTPVTQSNPSSPASESYHTIRTNIQFREGKAHEKVILVTSANHGEGRTITVCNLAVTVAQSGLRVLLVDADMRKPDIHHRFHIPAESGLSRILSGEKSTPEYHQVSDIPGLHILPSGPKPTNPASLLSAAGFANWITNSRREFDMILIDAPPLLAASDALVIARVVDGVVFLVDAQKTNRAAAQKSLAAVQRLNNNIIGGILNRLPKRSRKYPIGTLLQETPPVASMRA